ncbi:glycosyltransferase family 2 protein, partial [Leclercia sp. Colony189]
MLKLFVAAIIKNEMDALLEWIAYHRVVGVSGFIIADNGSNDGSRAFL